MTSCYPHRSARWSGALLFAALISILTGCHDEPTRPIEQQQHRFTPSASLVVLSGLSWSDLAPTGGPPTSMGTVVLDPGSNRAIEFAGCCNNPNDVWALVNANGVGGATQWVNLIPNGAPGSPPGRHSHSAVYDAVNNRMIVFGGCLGGCFPITNDVWVLGNANGVGGTPTWTQLSPSGGAPAPRGGHTAVYDPNTNRMIIFGGQNGSCCASGTFQDTWVLTNANGLGGQPSWIQLSPSGGPPAGGYFASAAYDAANNLLMVFGGNTLSGSSSNAVWVLSNANGLGGTPVWSQLIGEGAAGSPSARSSASVGYDPAANELTLFGGGDGSGTLRDVWVLANANGIGGAPVWTQLSPSGGPPAATTRAVLDVVANRLITMGGSDAGAAWVLAGAAAPNCVSPPAGLVSWWRGEGDARDVMGRNDGSFGGDVTFGPGMVGNAFTLAGGRGVDVGNATSLHLSTGDFTVELWFQWAQLGYRGQAPLVIKMAVAPNIDGWNFAVDGPIFRTGGGDHNTGTQVSFPAADFPQRGVWYHAAAVKRGGTIELYLNGDQATVSTPINVFFDSNSADMVFGYDPTQGDYLVGQLDEVTVYDRALDPAEIAAIYHAGSAGKCVPPPIQPPTASAGGPYTGSEGSAVSFDASGSADPQGQPLTYDWDFGDGSPHGSGVNPVHVYADNGSYNVTLVVSNVSRSATANATATIFNLPPTVHAGQGASLLTGQAFALSASFTDPGVNDAPWATSVDWGDGTTILQGASNAVGSITGVHTYVSAGTFSVKVRVVDKDGAVDQGFAQVTVAPANRPPMASAGGPYTGTEGAGISFTGAGSSDPDGDVITYSWNFGDGSSPASGVSPTHAYADNGSYTVTLTVSDGQLSSVATATATVSNVPPTVNAGPDAAALTVQAFTLNATFADPGSNDGPWGTSINWGDGTPPQQGSANAQGAISGSHTYQSSSTYDVTVTVTDKDGTVGIDGMRVTVTGSRPPQINGFAVSTATPNEGQVVGFSAQAGDIDNDPLTYTLDFGDGSTPAHSLTATHAYADNGTYTAVLTVSDYRFSTTASIVVTVANIAPSVDAGQDAGVFKNQPFALNASFTDPGLHDAPWVTTVDWGDGSPTVQGSASAPGAIGGTHTYSSPGSYVVTVRVIDKDGASGSDVAAVTVSDRAPVANAGGPYFGNEAASISFSATGSSDPDGDPLAYTWSFGDGSAPVTGAMVTHSYTDNGSYPVTVTVSDGQLTNSATTTANVLNVVPSATFNHPGTTKEGSKFMMSLTNPIDPSPIDQSAGFTYAFDCGAGYGAFSVSNSVSCPTVDNGLIPIRAALRDKDGGVREYVGQQTVTNLAPNVTALGSPQKLTQGGIAVLSWSFTDAGVQDGPWTIVIDWGVATTTMTTNVQNTVITQSYPYLLTGTYHVRMSVTDKDGGTGTSSSVTVKVQ